MAGCCFRAAPSIGVTSDGFHDFAPDPQSMIRAAAKLAPAEAVDQLIAAAVAGDAGDNIGVAVWRRP